MLRSHTCGELRKEHKDASVTLAGWVHRTRHHGGVSFLDLRDRYGITQLVLHEHVDLSRDSVIQISGKVVEKPEPNKKLATGEIEVQVDSWKLLSKANVLPIDDNATDEARLKYRYLDMRKPPMQHNMKSRHRISKITRDFFDKQGFLELETPMLAKSTPEGARDYLVPSRVHAGSFYALPQSPQLFKQLFMISGFDRYMQIVRCFRDEDLRADRQPEFTQIDLEMSFVDVEDIIAINEEFIAYLWKEYFGSEVALPIQRLTYAEAMERFGTDRPDLRFDLELQDVTEIAQQAEFNVFQQAESVYCLPVAHAFSRKEIDKLTELVKIHKAKGLAFCSWDGKELTGGVSKFLSSISSKLIQKLGIAKDVTLFFVADTQHVCQTALGALRSQLGQQLNLLTDEYKFCWVTDFPMFEYDEEEKRYIATHHPFTMPTIDSVEQLSDDKIGSLTSKAYDIVLNGTEIGGGSIRIHDQAIQERVFELLGMPKEEAQDRFGFFVEALTYGTPPHGGIAYGLDRLVALMTGNTSIREVIAFPKTKNAEDLMMQAPSNVDTKQLDELHIKTK